MKKIFLDIETTGLNFYRDRITAIGYAIQDKEPTVLINENESELVSDFVDVLCKENHKVQFQLVTWNGSNFDLGFIYVKTLLYQPKSAKLIKSFFSNNLDLKDYFPECSMSGYKRRAPSMEECLKFFNLPVKTASGFDAIYMFKFNKLEELSNYCKNDIIALRNIYNKIEESL